MRRAPLLFAIIAMMSAAPSAFGQTKEAAQIPLPKGYEELFRELAGTMKKHPGAGERFTIRDSKPDYSVGAGRCCMTWGCPDPTVLTDPACTCSELCPR
jgi:hypothetical protein